MELTLGNVEDDKKFAFLLGSALRNEDTEQVLAIYDDLIPRLISETRLKKIKEGARQISELPEHEFNTLAIDARQFSLAPGRSSMSQANWSSATPSINQDVNDDKVGLATPDVYNSSKKHKSYQDEDSGLDSYKHSESFGLDTNDTEEECCLLENVNIHCKAELVRITPTFNPPYDEEVKIDSSTGGSSIESPRSETSATHDEYSLMEEGTEMDTLSYKETPLRQHSYACFDYIPTRATARKDDDDIENHDLRFLNQGYKKAPTDVDKCINLGLNYGMNDKKDDTKAFLKFQHHDEKRKWSSSDGHDPLLDVNGNPKIKDGFDYAQMRKRPENGSSVILAHGPNHCINSSGESGTSRKRRSHKKKEETIKAEDCENYKGRLPINDLIVYITGKRVAVDANGAGDFISKSEKTKKRLEKSKKDKSSVCSKEKKKVEASGSFSYNGTHEILDSLSTTVTLSIPLESKEKCSVSLSPESMQKMSSELPLRHLHKNTEPAPNLMDFSTKVISKQNSPGKGSNDINDSSETLNRSEVVEAVTNADIDDTYYGACDINLASNLNQVNSLELTSDIKTEESFTEVKKKNKRAGFIRISSASSMTASSVKSYFNGSFYHNNNKHRHNAPQVTSNSAMHSLVVCNHSHSPRDLSPSSFPALAGTPPRIDVRRNSCDGINTVALDTKNDSDRESVKSLPVTHCARAVGEMSPIYMVSYATMVAAPPRCDNGNSSESSVVSASLSSAHTACLTPEKKTTVWKGSPRERRHSIGSSPEDKTETDRPTITQRNRQKSGSQELLCRESSAVFKGSSIKAVNNLQSHVKQEENVGIEKSYAFSNNNLERVPLSSTNISNDSLSSVSQDTPFSIAATKIPQTFDERFHSDNGMTSNEVKSEAVPNIDTKCQWQVSTPNSNTNTSILESAKKSNTNNHKSVVFLDKRYSTFPSKNLGITFGFDSSFESISDSTSQAVKQLSQNTKASQTKPTSASMPVDSNIPPDSGASLASGLHVSSSSDNSQNLKARLVQSHCNGLIVPTGDLKEETLGQTALDNRTKSCGVVVQETSSSQPLIVKSNSSASSDTSLAYLTNFVSCSHSSSTSSAVMFSPNLPPPSYSSPLTAPTSFINQANPVSSDHSTESSDTSVLQEVDFIHSCIPVVYGLKIQPNKGCGTVLFIPPNVQISASSSAVCSFLKKQWTEVNKNKNNAGSFVTCEDED
ncbi:uncharacterized protein LOC106070164 isoform X2 [Biomphalaria glabrata]|uniref:Uncharacterized protein LOC106070164 isoform X2 n=1 Tax=Biomphalaria glabrata TaxID=6526 RepID=A0A9W2YI24_BIOGL|nr:uncharacterized protein LOC106070164 isoform X2 [Biomphalaria glabrata]KAI8782936.1 mucin-5AC isoform X1 [Biomphalaria glabrata]